MRTTLLSERHNSLPFRDDVSDEGRNVPPLQSGQPRTYPPMQRRTHTKSRNGCKNCKIRRLKCDEEKPYCQKCLKARLLCEYSKKRTSGVQSRPLVPKSNSNIVSKTKYPSIKFSSPAGFIKPLQVLFNNETDFQYFNFFQTKTAKNLSGFFDDEIWNRLILQSCQQEEFARLAVVAIAALHKTTEFPSSSTSSSTMPGFQSRSEHHTYALKKYAKALKLMRVGIGNVDTTTTDEHLLRKTLVSALLTTCFESFHGNHEAAITQASTAVRLLFSVRERISSPICPQIGNSIIDRDLLSIFARLELGTMIITRKEVVPQDDTVKGREDDVVLAKMPLIFHTLREARFYWDILLRRSTSWRASYGYAVYEPDGSRREEEGRIQDLHIAKEEEEAVHIPETTYSDQEPKPLNLAAMIGTPVPAHRLKRLEAQLMSYWEMFQRWTAAFTPFYAKVRLGDRKAVEYQGATILMIGLQAAGLNSGTRDAKGPDDVFSTKMLDLIKEVLWWERVSRRGGGEEEKVNWTGNQDGSIFVFDSCIIHHLFIVATRSHDRFVRREAATILKTCKRREGLWDSEFAAKVTEWFAKLDEAEDVDGEEEGDKRKAKLVVTDEEFDLVGRKAWVRCKRIGTEDDFLPIMSLRW